MTEERSSTVKVNSKKKSLMDALGSKKRRTSTMKMTIDGTEYEWTFQALSGIEMDKLRAKHPATAAQKRENPNATLNLDTYHPAFLAACSLNPEITVDEAKDLFENENISGGELESIIMECYKVNNEGLGIPFTESA